MAIKPAILIVALSGRALAASARRSGYRAIVADLFDDVDTRRHAAVSVRVKGSLRKGLAATDLLRVTGELAPPPVALVYGSGFDRRTRLLQRLAAGRLLLGNTPTVMRRMKDPTAFFPLLDELNIPHPETRLTPPQNPRGWLAKRIGGGGGAHIRPAGAAPGKIPYYYQRLTAGRSVSALLAADGNSARLLGYTEQWSAPGLGGGPFRYGGAVFPAGLPARLADDVDGAVRRLASAAGLIGVNSVDMLIRDDGFDVLEVNPRPGATVDIFDRLSEGRLFDIHVKACEGALPDQPRWLDRAHASAIVYADRGFIVPSAFDWPAWVADLPEPGSHIRRGEPICTVSAEDRNPQAARRKIARHTTEVLAATESRAYSSVSNRTPAATVGRLRHPEVMT